jgi:hypothetical protein
MTYRTRESIEQAFLVPSVQSRVTSRVNPLSAILATGRPTTATPHKCPFHALKLHLWPCGGAWCRWNREMNAHASA